MRACRIEVDALLVTHLGKPVPEFGKAAAVALLAGRTCPPKFSKYAGALEWRNAVVLWVNIGGSDYANVFSEKGATMSWFASPQCHADSPIVSRLLGSSTQVLLFCRLPQQPYVCCGRLACVSHDLERRPLRFMWRLRDIDKLRGRDEFDELLAE